jgi:actin-related protein
MDSSRHKFSMYVNGMIHLTCTYARPQVDPHDTSLMITEPYMNLPNIQEIYDQFVFEEYGFQSYYRSAGEC